MGLEIAFLSKELRATCESPARAKRELGTEASLVLRRHLADMEAVDTAAELIEMGLGTENCAEDPGMLRLHLADGMLLHCKVNHQSVPMNGNTVDWIQVTRLMVTRIGRGE